jgi:hypothetical protein
MYGRVTHPDNLEPAIQALTDKGREHLKSRCEGRDVTPTDIAMAADFERGYGKPKIPHRSS